MSNNSIKTFGSGETSPEDIRNRKITIFSMMAMGVFIVPMVVLTAFTLWSLVNNLRINPKVIYASYAIFAVLSAIAGFMLIKFGVITDAVMGIVNLFIGEEPFSIGTLVTALLVFYLAQIPFALIIGGAIGCGYIAFRMFFRDRWKELDFRLTPLQVNRKKKHIREIQQDLNSPPDGRTLGVEKYGDKIVQTNKESRAHTMVLGASGTGKAVCLRTPILTSQGYKLMKDVRTGDLVFDERMKLSSVLGAFDTEYDKPAYTFTFSNGEQITTDEEHLWTISTGETVTTKALVKRMEQGRTITISAPERRPAWFDMNNGTPAVDPFIAGSYLQLMSGDPLLGGVQGPLLAAEWLNRGYRLIQDAQGAYRPDEDSRNRIGDVDYNDYLATYTPVREQFFSGVLRSGGFIVEPKEHDFSRQVFGYECRDEKLLHVVIELATCLGENVLKDEDTVLLTASNGYARTEDMDIRAGYAGLLETLRENETEYTILSYEATRADVRCIKVSSPSELYLAGSMCVPTHNTTTLMLMARDIIKQGHGFVMVDVKGGTDVPEMLASYAERYGRPFYHWTMQDQQEPYKGPGERPAYYEPITRGDPSRRKDLILNLRQWDASADVYAKATAAYLQTLFNVIRVSPTPDDMDTITDVVNLMQGTPVLLSRLDSVPPAQHDEYYTRVRKTVLSMQASNDKLQKEAIRTMQQTLQIFSQSIAGPWLGQDPKGELDINLWDVANEGAVVCFSLDSSNYPDLSQSVANLIIQDLKTASSEFRQNRPANTLDVFIDEFSAIESSNLVQLVNKCRDADIPVVFATQTIADMKAVSETFAQQLNGIISSFIIHRINDSREAEEYAGIIGTQPTPEFTQEIEHTSSFGGIGFGAATGKGRLTYKEDFIVPVKEFQKLRMGEMIYHTKASTDGEDKTGLTRKVQVIPESGYVVVKDTAPPKSAETLERFRDIENADPTVSWRDVTPDPMATPMSEPSRREAPVPAMATTMTAQGSTASAVKEGRSAVMTAENNDYDDMSYDFPENEELGSISSKGVGLKNILNLSVLGKESKKARALLNSSRSDTPPPPTPEPPQEAPESDEYSYDTPEPDYEPYEPVEEPVEPEYPEATPTEEDEALAPIPKKRTAPRTQRAENGEDGPHIRKPSRTAPPRPKRPQRPGVPVHRMQRPAGEKSAPVRGGVKRPANPAQGRPARPGTRPQQGTKTGSRPAPTGQSPKPANKPAPKQTPKPVQAQQKPTKPKDGSPIPKKRTAPQQESTLKPKVTKVNVEDDPFSW